MLSCLFDSTHVSQKGSNLKLLTLLVATKRQLVKCGCLCGAGTSTTSVGPALTSFLCRTSSMTAQRRTRIGWSNRTVGGAVVVI